MSNQSADDVACHYVMEGKAHELREEGEKEGGWRKGKERKGGRTKRLEYLSPLLHYCLVATAAAALPVIDP